MNRVLFFFSFFLICLNFHSKAQDTIVLLTGKTIIAKNVEIGGYSVSYFGLKEGSKQKRVNAENVFSIKFTNGTERVLYEPDSLEETDFRVDQMRMFILGEQDAMKFYKNDINKATAFICGAGAVYFGFYGIVGPAVYSTVVGSFSPAMEKQKVSDLSLLRVDEYREGYIRKARDKKVKNSILYGLAGFAAGFAAYYVAYNN